MLIVEHDHVMAQGPAGQHHLRVGVRQRVLRIGHDEGMCVADIDSLAANAQRGCDSRRKGLTFFMLGRTGFLQPELLGKPDRKQQRAAAGIDIGMRRDGMGRRTGQRHIDVRTAKLQLHRNRYGGRGGARVRS